MNSGRNIVRLGAAVLAAGLAGACARDAAGPRAVTAPGAVAEVREGVALHGRLVRRLVALDRGGAVVAESTTTEAFDAEVQGGRAVANARGLVLAVTGESPGHREAVRGTDAAGHRHELIPDGPEGEPPTAIRALLDGRMFARVELTWQRTGHGFVLSRRSTTFFDQDGTPVAREDLSVETGAVAGAGRAALGAAAAYGAAALPFGPSVNPFVMVDCVTATLTYVSTSGALVVATDRLFIQPYSIRNWIVFFAAAGAWSAAFDAYTDSCSYLYSPYFT